MADDLELYRQKKAKEASTYEEFCKWSGIDLRDKSLDYKETIQTYEEATKRYRFHGWELNQLYNALKQIPDSYWLYEYLGVRDEERDGGGDAERVVDALYGLVDLVDDIIRKRGFK